MSGAAPDPVEVWAPLFLYYGGNRKAAKYTKEQVLDPKFAITFGHCKLCDAALPQGEQPDKHMREHRKELTAWLTKQRRAAESRSQSGLKTHRKEQEMLAKAEADRLISVVGIGGEDDE